MLWTDDETPDRPALPVVLVARVGSSEARRRRLRGLAAAVLGIAVDGVEIAHREGRPPAILRPSGSGLFCSSASRGDMAALALARLPIGVDVELVGGADEIPWRVLHDSEADWLRQRDVADRAAAFARLWSLKEAFLKALGRGLAREPASFAVRVLDDTRAEIDDPLATAVVALARSIARVAEGKAWAVSAVMLARLPEGDERGSGPGGGAA